MSIIKKHDIVDDILICQENNERLAKLSKDKLRWEQMDEKDREELIKIYQSKCIKEKNVSFKCSFPFLKQTTIDCLETYTGTISNLNTGIFVYIDLNRITPFINLKNKWLYFKLCKIEVNFRNNSKSSFIPISCYYLPPCFSCVNVDYKFSNNVKIASGINVEHKSILNPLYVIRSAYPDKDLTYYDNINDNGKSYYDNLQDYSFPSSGLQDNLFISNFNNSKLFLDYGKFIFNTDNLQNNQDILIKINYSFKFYTYGNPEAYYDSGILNDDDGDDNLDDS